MLSCDEFRLQTGANPGHLGFAQRFHRVMCGACRRFATDVRRLDRRLSAAFRLDVGTSDADALPPAGPRRDA